MKQDTFFDVLTQVDDALLERASQTAIPRRRRAVRLVSGIAAALAIAVLGTGVIHAIFYSPAGAGGGGATDQRYMAYCGPVLPLTALNDADGVTVTRAIDYDFSSYADGWSSQTQVTDSYVLTNPHRQDVTIELAYPFAEHLNADVQHLPQITIDGKTIEFAYYPGPYYGGYMGVWGGGDEENGSVNLDGPDSYEEFRDILVDGSYQAAAFDDFPVLDQPVIVYEITDPIILTEEEKRGTNPSLAMQFYMDDDRTSVLTYNTNGARWDRKSGFASHSFSVPEEGEYDFGASRYILIMGDDIDGYSLQGYRDGGCDKGEEIDITATVTRYESTIGAFLWERITERSTYVGDDGHDGTSDGYLSIADAVITDEMFFGLCAELLMTDAFLAADGGVERYESGRLGDILSAVRTNPRVMYLAFEVTIPAGSQIMLDCRMLRDAHMNYLGEATDCHGYDMATTLGSSLTFTAQTASVSHTDAIEIVAQNFGFDLDRGITAVTLDVAQEHYWMEVRARRAS